MNNYVRMFLVLFASLLSFSANSEGQEKNFALGFGSYALTLAYDNPAWTNDEFSGGAISLMYAFTDNVALKGALYSLENKIDSRLEASGLDLALLAGTGLASEGFKLYGGGGIFNETWEISGLTGEEDFSGIQFIGGLGYNWSVISIDLSLALRETSDYVDFLERLPGSGSSNVMAITGAFTVSVRF